MKTIWRLLEIGEVIQPTDEYLHIIERQWRPVKETYWAYDEEVITKAVQIYRRREVIAYVQCKDSG